MAEGCGDCHECVDICPVKAFTGEPFRETDPRKVHYDAHKCDNYPGTLGKDIRTGGVWDVSVYLPLRKKTG